MANEIRTVCFDSDLKIEAYRFEGIMQKFPNHFHDYYVIGFIENGQRYLQCNNHEYIVKAGDLVVFNPMDTHTCEQADGKPLDYRSINVQPEIMQKAVLEITGDDRMPRFTQTVLYRSELAGCLHDLHLMILEEATDFKKEELFLLLIEQLLRECSDAPISVLPTEPALMMKTVCDYLETNYAKTITLDDLSELAGLSKYYFLRSFTRQKGISPYSYLETIRIGRAKKLLEKGVPPIDVAFQTGFSDQSHFSNFFKKLIGLTPKQYMKIFTGDTRSPLEDSAN